MTDASRLRVVVSPKGREAAQVQKVQKVQRVQRGGIAFGDEYEVSVTVFPLVSPVLHDEEQKPPSLGRNPAEDF